MNSQSDPNDQETLSRLTEENSFLRSALEKTDHGKELIRQREELSLLLAVSKLIVSELNLDAVFQLVASKARELVEADLVLVPMLNEQRDRYAYKAASGVDAETVLEASFPVTVGMCGWVLQNEQSLLFGEASPCWLGEMTCWEKGQQSAILVPLFGRKQIIGGLSALGKKGGGSFSTHDLDLLTMFANQVSTAIENAILFQQVEIEMNERRRAEKDYKQLSHQQELILNSAGEGIYGVDMNGCVTFINPAAADMLGWDVEELLGKNSHSTWHYLKADGTHYPVEECILHNLFNSETGTEATRDVFQKKNCVSFPVEYIGTPIIENDRRVGAVITFRDITEHTRVEAEKKKLEEQLLQAQKMESIGTLAGGVAHDFNNILTAIMGYGNITLMKMAKDDPLRQNIEQILEASDRAAHLTRDLLLFSRKQPLDRKPLDLNEVIQKLGKFLTRVIGEDIAFKITLSGGVIPVLADEHQIGQVLMNLATNARDAMLKGGILTIATEHVLLDEEAAFNLGLGASGRYVMISVSDTGHGMDEKLRHRIFEPFFTTKEVGKGTGLGLAVVYGIIRQHEGNIKVYSEPDQGTTFRIYLPVIATGVAGDKEPVPEALPVGGTETILLAEDNAAVRNLTETVLKEFGYVVITAVDGEDAIGKYQENKDSIQLLILDLIMPKKNGKEAYDEIRKIRPDIKAIFASGYSPDIVRDKASIGSEVTVIFKPITPKELLKKVRTVLDADKVRVF